jgi:UDP-N-acetylmuramate-alanine ligase
MRHPDANFASDFEQATDFLSAHLKPEAVLLVLSAGDADRISAKVLAARSESEEDYA